MSSLYSSTNMFIYGFKSHRELLDRLLLHDKSSDEGFIKLLNFYLNSNVGDNVSFKHSNLNKVSYMCYHFICKAIVNRILFYYKTCLKCYFIRSDMIAKFEDKIIRALDMKSKSYLEDINSQINLAKEDRRDYTGNAVNYANSYNRIKEEIIKNVTNINLDYNSDSILRTYRYLKTVLDLVYYYSIYSSYSTNVLDIERQYDIYVNTFNMAKANIDFSKLKIADKTVASITATNMNILTVINDETSNIETSEEALNYIKCNINLSDLKEEEEE